MIRGITFDKQLMKSKDHAHEVNYYYSGDLGITKGCVPSVNASNDIVVTEGYFIVKGRLISIEGSETIDVPTVPSGTLYSVLVFEIDLTKTNTTTVFNQGAFKILSNASAYPTLTQQDLDNGGTLYQFEFARFENTVGGLVNFIDTRVVLEMTKYATKAENALKAPINNPTFTGTVSGITKSMVGLGNVDNTSDANKPISTATQTALDLKANQSTTYTKTESDTLLNTKSLKNWIINGGFDVWQRGTSSTTSNYNADDRFYNGHSTSTKTTSRQAFAVGQTEVPNNPTYYSRTIVTSGGTSTSRTYKTQNIEDVSKLAGKTVSISFWAKADSTKNMSIYNYQYFGVGGSADVNFIGVQKFALTTSWQRFTKTFTIPSISGKTIGDGSCFGITFYFDAGSNFNAHTDSLGNQSGTFDIANVSLVEGSVPVEWQTEAYADVLRQCQRYYQRYGDINDVSIYQLFASGGFAESSTIVYGTIIFPTQMRAKPSSVEYSNVAFANYYGTLFAMSSITLNNPSKLGTSFYGTVSGINAGTAGRVVGNNNINAYLAFNAEL